MVALCFIAFSSSSSRHHSFAFFPSSSHVRVRHLKIYFSRFSLVFIWFHRMLVLSTSLLLFAAMWRWFSLMESCLSPWTKLLPCQLISLHNSITDDKEEKESDKSSHLIWLHSADPAAWKEKGSAPLYSISRPCVPGMILAIIAPLGTQQGHEPRAEKNPAMSNQIYFRFILFLFVFDFSFAHPFSAQRMSNWTLKSRSLSKKIIEFSNISLLPLTHSHTLTAHSIPFPLLV